MTAPSLKSHNRQPSIFSSFSKWTGNRTPSAGASCNSITENIHTIAGDSRTSSSGLLCALCLRDLHRQGIAELECGHNFHSHCLKNVISKASFLTLDPKMSFVWITLSTKETSQSYSEIHGTWKVKVKIFLQLPPQFTRIHNSHKHKQVLPQQFVESHQFFKLHH